MPEVNSRMNGVLVFAFLAVALMLGLMLFFRYQNVSKHQEPSQAVKSGSRIIALFFPDETYSYLVREGRETDACDDTVSCAREILLELQNGPVGDSSPAFPEGAPLPDLSVISDTAAVDFHSDFVSAMEGGSSEEQMIIYSIVNSITVNLPEIKQVRFTVDGKPAETLKGHIDIRMPLEPDPSMEKQIPYKSYSANSKGDGGIK